MRKFDETSEETKAIKWLDEKMNEYKEMEHDDAFAFEYVLDKLKELKGSVKE